MAKIQNSVAKTPRYSKPWLQAQVEEYTREVLNHELERQFTPEERERVLECVAEDIAGYLKAGFLAALGAHGQKELGCQIWAETDI